MVAADIDPRFLEGLDEPSVEVRCHDLRSEDFPLHSFDLVHTRFVLEPDRINAMKRIVDWLKPGGWLLFEEPDCYAGLASPNRLWARHMEAHRACCACTDLEYGRALPAEVGDLGLVDLGCDIDVTVVRGGTNWPRGTASQPRRCVPGQFPGAVLDRKDAVLLSDHEEHRDADVAQNAPGGLFVIDLPRRRQVRERGRR